jgi:hypothetical protein
LRRIVLALIVLALVSAVLILVVPRYLPVDTGPVAGDRDFAGLATGAPSVWQRVGDGRVEPVDGGVRLINEDAGATVGLDQVLVLPPGINAFRVAATVTLEGVSPGPERWQQARMFIQTVPEGASPHFHGPHQLIDRSGDYGPHRLSADFPVVPDTPEARLMIRLQRATGAMVVQHLEIEPLVRNPARMQLRHGLMAVWLVIGAGIAGTLWWQSRNRVAATLVLAGLGLMALTMVLPYGVRQPLHQLLHDVAGGEQQLALLKPALHLVAFAVLAMASRLAQPQRPLAFFVACWLAAAVLLELAELLVGLFDSDDVIDMAFNAAGAMIGLAVAGRLLQRRRDQEEAPDPATDRLVSRRP